MVGFGFEGLVGFEDALEGNFAVRGHGVGAFEDGARRGRGWVGAGRGDVASTAVTVEVVV